MKTIIKLTIIVFLLYSCKKEVEPITPIDRTITLTGKIIHNCAGNPVKNRDVEIYVVYGGWSGEIVNVKTDSNGNFNWTFETKQSVLDITLRVAGLGDILTFDPKLHQNLGTIVANPTANVVIKIKVNNPYSLGDTLLLKDLVNYPAKNLKISAPFKDTVLSVAYSYSQLSWPGTFEQKNTTFVETNIYIYKGVSGTSSLQVLYDRWIDDRFKSCTGAVDTLLIEIN